MRGLAGVVAQLLADLAVDLVPQLRPEDSVASDEVKLLQVGGGSCVGAVTVTVSDTGVTVLSLFSSTLTLSFGS